MATMYVAWHKYPTKVVGMTTMQTEGSFLSSAAIDISAGGVTQNAPEGCEYATVWSDVPFYVLSGQPVNGVDPAAAKAASSMPLPAQTLVQIANIAALATKIAGIAI